MDRNRRAYLFLHIAIILWGFTAILGDLISLTAFWLVWWRVGLASIGLSVIPNVISQIKRMPSSSLLILFGISILIALHWLTFFGSIKYANASIALVALSTTAFFTSFIEPVFLKKELSKIDMLFGLAVIPGMMLIVQDLSGDMLLGLLIGLISAFLSALFAVLNKKHIDIAPPRVITFLELSGAWVFLTIMIPISLMLKVPFGIPHGWDWVYLAILSFICTNGAFTLHLRALKYISAFAANLIINLEPVYGIILAAILLHDHKELNPSFYIGMVMVLACVFFYPIVLKKNRSAKVKITAD